MKNAMKSQFEGKTVHKGGCSVLYLLEVLAIFQKQKDGFSSLDRFITYQQNHFAVVVVLIFSIYVQACVCVDVVWGCVCVCVCLFVCAIFEKAIWMLRLWGSKKTKQNKTKAEKNPKTYFCTKLLLFCSETFDSESSENGWHSVHDEITLDQK